MELFQIISEEYPNFLAFAKANWSILIIPFVAAFVGWGTNILALKMTFYPLEFFGIELFPMVKPVGWKARMPRIGWQGIIPMKAGKITGKTVDLLTSQLISIEEQFAKIDPKQVSVELSGTVNKLSKEIIDEAMTAHIPLIWKMVPRKRKQVIFEQAGNEFPLVVEDIMQEIKENITELFDLKGMAIEAFTKDKQLLNDLFQKCGAKEFKFIERSGFYFGFLFGLVQMMIWYYYPAWWILPVGGLIVGYATNWLALKMIFYPQNPIKLGPITIQGMFLKRQKEVAKEYAEMVTKEILTSTRIFDTIINGKSSEKIMHLVEKHVKDGVDKTAGLNRSLIQISSGTKRYDAIKAIAVKRFLEAMPISIQDAFGYADDALDIENTLREKMAALEPKKYAGVLRPAFQEDEWKLILTGALLGLGAGLIQLLMLG